MEHDFMFVGRIVRSFVRSFGWLIGRLFGILWMKQNSTQYTDNSDGGVKYNFHTAKLTEP